MHAAEVVGRYLGGVVWSLIALQLLIWRFLLQREPNDPMMSVADAGFLLLPLSLLLLALGLVALRRRRFVPGLGALLFSVPNLLLAGWSLYMYTL